MNELSTSFSIVSIIFRQALPASFCAPHSKINGWKIIWSNTYTHGCYINSFPLDGNVGGSENLLHGSRDLGADAIAGYECYLSDPGRIAASGSGRCVDLQADKFKCQLITNAIHSDTGSQSAEPIRLPDVWLHKRHLAHANGSSVGAAANRALRLSASGKVGWQAGGGVAIAIYATRAKYRNW